jgi:hypothetical protein
MSRSERDLVTALRDELAAIDPSRACDRTAELAGLATTVEPASRGRPARRRGSAASDRTRHATPSTGTAAEHCRTAVAARPVPGARVAEPGRRSDPPRVRRPADEARSSPAPRGVGLPARGGCGAAAASSPGRARVGRDVPAPDRAAGRLLELEARQVSRALRGELNRVLNAESANLQRAVAPPAASSMRSRSSRRRPAARSSPTSVRLVADARARPRGDARRARRAARPAPLGGPAGARAARAAGRGRAGAPSARPPADAARHRVRNLAATAAVALWHDPRACVT